MPWFGRRPARRRASAATLHARLASPRAEARRPSGRCASERAPSKQGRSHAIRNPRRPLDGRHDRAGARVHLGTCRRPDRGRLEDRRHLRRRRRALREWHAVAVHARRQTVDDDRRSLQARWARNPHPAPAGCRQGHPLDAELGVPGDGGRQGLALRPRIQPLVGHRHSMSGLGVGRKTGDFPRLEEYLRQGTRRALLP